MQWVVSQIGRREDYFLARMFQRRGELACLYTDWWVPSGHRLLRRAGGRVRDLTNRFHPEIPRPSARSFNARFLGVEVAKRLIPRPGSPTGQYEQALRERYLYDRLVARDLARSARASAPAAGAASRGFIGFCSECTESLAVAAGQGAVTVVDQYEPGRVEDELLVAEAGRWPGWEPAHPARPPQWYERVEAEWRAADVVLVNSPFSRDCIVRQGAEPGKIIVVPLAYEGTPARTPKVRSPRLSALWLGRVVLQKGIQYLLDAARRLADEPIDFLVAGPIGISAEAVARFPGNVRFLGKVSAARKIELYRQSDVFVLPTLTEGFAITQIEAMAHGLPVITTGNCGKVVTDGEDGFVIPARDGEALARKLLLLHRERDELRRFSAAAYRKSGQFSMAAAAEQFYAGLERVTGRAFARAGAPGATSTAAGRVAPAVPPSLAA